MCLWNETTGKKGSNEVASSILAFLNKINLDQYEDIHTFSDCCGGQNRNKNIVSFFVYICENTHIKSWTHKFLESGHSYLPNDTDFGKIEKAKKNTFGIYSEEQWHQVIENCKFNVLKMKDAFFDVSEMQKCLKFTAKDSNGDKLRWHNLKWTQIFKKAPYQMKFKYSNCREETPKTINLEKRRKKIQVTLKDFQLKKIHTDPLKISYAKYKDLQKLTRFIPPVYNSFFANLQHKTPSKQTEYEYLPDVDDDDDDVDDVDDDDDEGDN